MLQFLYFVFFKLEGGIQMKVMVPFAEGFEEVEALTIVDVLRRADIQVDTVGVIGSVINGAHGIRVMVDKRLSEVKQADYDAIILPGGNPGYINLGRSGQLIEMVKKFNSQNKLIGAICGAPSILAKEGLLDNKRATIYPGNEKLLAYPRDKPVVIDGNIITSQGPGTAMEFAIRIVEKLLGTDKALKLKQELVA
jgi:4-methyl-5(b-hydroxyethyl)-thiazole monophosphate biosynthesis